MTRLFQKVSETCDVISSSSFVQFSFLASGSIFFEAQLVQFFSLEFQKSGFCSTALFSFGNPKIKPCCSVRLQLSFSTSAMKVTSFQKYESKFLVSKRARAQQLLKPGAEEDDRRLAEHPLGSGTRFRRTWVSGNIVLVKDGFLAVLANRQCYRQYSR